MGPSPPSPRGATPGEPVHPTPLPGVPSSPCFPGELFRAGIPSPVARPDTPDLEAAGVRPPRPVRRQRGGPVFPVRRGVAPPARPRTDPAGAGRHGPDTARTRHLPLVPGVGAPAVVLPARPARLSVEHRLR